MNNRKMNDEEGDLVIDVDAQDPHPHSELVESSLVEDVPTVLLPRGSMDVPEAMEETDVDNVPLDTVPPLHIFLNKPILVNSAELYVEERTSRKVGPPNLGLAIMDGGASVEVGPLSFGLATDFIANPESMDEGAYGEVRPPNVGLDTECNAGPDSTDESESGELGPPNLGLDTTCNAGPDSIDEVASDEACPPNLGLVTEYRAVPGSMDTHSVVVIPRRKKSTRKLSTKFSVNALRRENSELKKQVGRLNQKISVLKSKLKCQKQAGESEEGEEQGEEHGEESEEQDEEDVEGEKIINEERIALLKSKLKNMRKSKEGFYADKNNFPIKPSLKKKLKSLFPNNPERCTLRLLEELYSRDFLEIHRKTATKATNGPDIKLPIKLEQLAEIRGALEEMYDLDQQQRKNIEQKITQKFNVNSAATRSWLNKYHNVQQQLMEELDKNAY